MKKSFFIISDGVFATQEKYQYCKSVINSLGITNYYDDTNDNGISFLFLEADGDRVISELFKRYPSSNDFFSDTYEYEEIVEMFGHEIADNLEEGKMSAINAAKK